MSHIRGQNQFPLNERRLCVNVFKRHHHCLQVAVWSGIAVVVPSEIMGLGLGLVISLTGFGIGLTNIVIGHLLGDQHTSVPALYFIASNERV